VIGARRSSPKWRGIEKAGNWRDSWGPDGVSIFKMVCCGNLQWACRENKLVVSEGTKSTSLRINVLLAGGSEAVPVNRGWAVEQETVPMPTTGMVDPSARWTEGWGLGRRSMKKRGSLSM
jgi:hypothetical protein